MYIGCIGANSGKHMIHRSVTTQLDESILIKVTKAKEQSSSQKTTFNKRRVIFSEALLDHVEYS